MQGLLHSESEIAAKLAGRLRNGASDWKKSRDSNGVYADNEGILCPS